MNKKRLVIVGDSAFAEIAREYFDADSAYKVVAHAVEGAYLKNDSLNGLPVVPLESLEHHFDPVDHCAHVAVTYGQLNRLRARLIGVVKSKGYELASYISSQAFVWPNVKLGEHIFIFENNTVQPFVEVGSNVVIWSGNHIGHHSVVHDNVFIASHVVVSGFCEIGASSFLGVNATIANNVKVASDNWLGPGTILMKDTQVGALFKAEATVPATVTAHRFFRVSA